MGRQTSSVSAPAVASKPAATRAIQACCATSSCSCGTAYEPQAVQRLAGNLAMGAALGSGDGGRADGLPASVSAALDQPGEPLEPDTLGTMEDALGRDLSAVRVHRGATAALAARDLGAMAFTAGRSIVFGAGHYRPRESAGRRLLGHELVHVAQQADGRTSMLDGVGGDRSMRASLEREASDLRVAEPRDAARAAARPSAGRGLSGSGAARATGGGAAVAQLARAAGSVRGAIQLTPIPGGCMAMMADPSSDMATGTAVHSAIRRSFRRQRGTSLNVQIPDASADPFRTEGRRRTIKPQRGGGKGQGTGNPDLAIRSSTGAAMLVAEIKAANLGELIMGEIQLANYIDKGNSPDNADLRARYGVKVFAPMLPSMYRPPRVLRIGRRRFQVAWCGPGILVYKEIKKKKKEKDDKKKRRKNNRRKATKTNQGTAKTPKSTKPPTPKPPKPKPPKPKAPKPKAPKPKAPKPKAPKPKAPKPTAPKAGAKAGAFNFGLGISIGGSGGGAGNVGVGISINSSGVAVGTVSAGIAYNSEGAAIGAVGAGISSSTSAAGALTAGAGVIEDSTVAGALVAGSGSSSGASGTAVLEARSGDTEGGTEAKDGAVQGEPGAAPGGAEGGTEPAGQDAGTGTQPGTKSDAGTGSQAGAGGRGTGESGSAGAGEGDAGTAPQGGRTASGGEGAGPDAGAGHEEDPHGGESAGPGADAGTTGTGTAPGSATEATPGTSAGGAPDQGTGPAAPSDAKLAEILAGLGLPRGTPGSAEAERALVDAIRLDQLVTAATPAQKILLRILAADSEGGTYLLPQAAWAEMMLSATAGLTEEDFEYLATLDWRPGRTSLAELRAQIQRALAQRGSRSKDGPPAEPEAPTGGSPGTGSASAAKGHVGQAKKGTKATKAEPGSQDAARSAPPGSGGGKGKDRDSAGGKKKTAGAALKVVKVKVKSGGEQLETPKYSSSDMKALALVSGLSVKDEIPEGGELVRTVKVQMLVDTSIFVISVEAKFTGRVVSEHSVDFTGTLTERYDLFEPKAPDSDAPLITLPRDAPISFSLPTPKSKE